LRKVIILTATFLMLICMVRGVPAGDNSQTIVSYNRTTEDLFPNLADINVSVSLVGSAKFTCSDGTVLPGGSTEYSIAASPENGTLTVNYDIDRPIVKRSGSQSKTFNPEWLLVENSIVVYDESPITITVTIHGHLNGHVTVCGNGSVAPSDIMWSDWETNNVTVSANANAENGQEIQVEVATEYVVYFTVGVELGLIDVFERNSTSRGVSGSPAIQSSIDVIPEFPNWIAWTAVIIAASLVALFGSKKSRSSR